MHAAWCASHTLHECNVCEAHHICGMASWLGRAQLCPAVSHVSALWHTRATSPDKPLSHPHTPHCTALPSRAGRALLPYATGETHAHAHKDMHTARPCSQGWDAAQAGGWALQKEPAESCGVC